MFYAILFLKSLRIYKLCRCFIVTIIQLVNVINVCGLNFIYRIIEFYFPPLVKQWCVCSPSVYSISCAQFMGNFLQPYIISAHLPTGYISHPLTAEEIGFSTVQFRLQVQELLPFVCNKKGGDMRFYLLNKNEAEKTV